jgi:FkbM family methyltransferase
MARSALAPLLPIDVTLTDPRNVKFLVTRDPVDARVVDDLTGSRRKMWIPAGRGGDDVELILDVGGHHGHYASAAAQVWPRARIIVVEPSEAAVALINRHIQMNALGDRVEVVQAAISDATGKGKLYHDPAGSWGSSLHDVGGGVNETVTLASLDDVLQGRRPDIVKCNAEGGEFSLIPQLLAAGLRPRLMVVMLHPEFGDADALVASIEAAGFVTESVGTDHRPALHARPKYANA